MGCSKKGIKKSKSHNAIQPCLKLNMFYCIVVVVVAAVRQSMNQIKLVLLLAAIQKGGAPEKTEAEDRTICEKNHGSPSS